jgi:hypothetical protein
VTRMRPGLPHPGATTGCRDASNRSAVGPVCDDPIQKQHDDQQLARLRGLGMSDKDDVLLDDRTADTLLVELGEAFAAEMTDERPRTGVNAFWMARTDELIVEVGAHLDTGHRAGARPDSAEREHLHRLGALTITLTVDPIERNVTGRIDGAILNARWLDASGSSRPLELDETRRFRISPPVGPAAIEVALVDGRRARTTWTLR